MSIEQILITDYNNPPKSEDEMNNRKNALISEPYRSSVINVLLQPNTAQNIRQLAYFAIKNYKIPVTPQEIENLYQLLFDDFFQKFISELIIVRTDQPEKISALLSFIKQKIQTDGPQLIVIKSYIFLTYHLIKNKMIYNEIIITDLIKIIIENREIDTEMRKLALETILRQILAFNNQNEDEIVKISNNTKNIIGLLNLIEINEANIPLFDYILKYIRDQTFFINKNFFDQNVIGCLFAKLIKIFEFISTNKYPIDINDTFSSTILCNIVAIYEYVEINEVIPFDKLFPYLLYTDQQIQLTQIDIDYFFGTFVGTSDNFSNNDDADDDDDDNDCFWDYMNNVSTLSQLQYDICTYACNKYLSLAFEYCKTKLNTSLNANIGCIKYFQISSVPIAIDPTTIINYNCPFMIFNIVYFCLVQIDKLDSTHEQLKNAFFIYLSNNLPAFAQTMLQSNNPNDCLGIFKIVSSAPIELVNPQMFATVLIESLKFFQLFKQEDNKNDFLEKIIDYLSQNISLTHEKINYILNPDPNCRRFISNSIYYLNDDYIMALKSNSALLFNRLYSILDLCSYSSYLVKNFCSILHFLSGNEISKYISRHRAQNETVVDVSQYSVFSEEIFFLVAKVIKENINNPNLVDCCYQLFTTLQFSLNDGKYIELAKFMYNHFIHSNFVDIKDIGTIELILRIFIKFGLLEGFDRLCFTLCSINHENIDFLVYELSFILINYSNESIVPIANLLIDVVMDEPSYYCKSVTLIFARVALQDKNKAQALLQSNNKFSIQDLLNLWLKYSIKSLNMFDDYLELEQRLIISFFCLFIENPQFKKIIQGLMRCMLNSLHKQFIKEDIGFQNSSIALIQDSIFYDDQLFLSNPMMTMSLQELANVTQSFDACKIFFAKYPNI